MKDLQDLVLRLEMSIGDDKKHFARELERAMELKEKVFDIDLSITKKAHSKDLTEIEDRYRYQW